MFTQYAFAIVVQRTRPVVRVAALAALVVATVFRLLRSGTVNRNALLAGGIAFVALGPLGLSFLAVVPPLAALAGAIVALVAIFLPSALMTSLVTANWESMRRSRWLASGQRGLAAVAFGLTAAGAYTIVHVAVTDLVSSAVAVGAFVLLWRWRLPPALVTLLGGISAVAFGLAVG